VLFEEGVQLFDNKELLDRLGERLDLVVAERIAHAELQVGRVGINVFEVLVGDTRSDEPELAVAPFDAVEPAPFGQCFELDQPFLDQDMSLIGVPRHHHILGGVPLEGRLRRHPAFAQGHVFLRVGDPRGHPHHHGRVEPLAEVERLLNELLGLRGTGRLQHRHLRVDRHPAGVLLVLGGVHAGIVGDYDDESGVDAGVGGRHQRVHRDVKPHVLAGEQAADPGHRGAKGHLIGHLLVHGPLRVDVFEPRQGFQDFGGRGPRIGTGNPQTRLIGSVRQRFIAGEQCFL